MVLKIIVKIKINNLLQFQILWMILNQTLKILIIDILKMLKKLIYPYKT